MLLCFFLHIYIAALWNILCFFTPTAFKVEPPFNHCKQIIAGYLYHLFTFGGYISNHMMKKIVTLNSEIKFQETVSSRETDEKLRQEVK